MRVLVTGGSGFVGRHLVRRLAADHEVITVQRRYADPSDRGVRAVALDLATISAESLADAARGHVDVVIHLAARLDNPFGVDYTLADLVGPNVVGTVRLLEAAAAVGIRRFVYGSTGGVGTNAPDGGRMREEDPPGPINPYGLTKHLAEQAVTAYRWPFDRTSLRYFAPYARDASNPMFIHHIDSIRRGAAIEVGSRGGPEINPIHIDDAVDATIAAMTSPSMPAVINVAGPDVVRMADMLRLLGAALGRAAIISERDDPDPSWAADIERMSTFLGAPRTSLADGIAREWGEAAR